MMPAFGKAVGGREHSRLRSNFFVFLLLSFIALLIFTEDQIQFGDYNFWG